MRPSNAVLVYDLNYFLQLDPHILSKITHLRLVNQNFDSLSRDKWRLFLDKLALCQQLYCLNISGSLINPFLSEQLVRIINPMYSLEIVVLKAIKNNSVTTSFFHLRPNIIQILDNSAGVALPNGWTMKHAWAAEELQEILLLGINLIRQYPNIGKFSRKRVSDTPFSILNVEGKPYLLLPTIESPEDIREYNCDEIDSKKVLSKTRRMRLAVSFANNRNSTLQFWFAKIRQSKKENQIKARFEQELINCNVLAKSAVLLERPFKSYIIFVPASGVSVQDVFLSQKRFYGTSFFSHSSHTLQQAISLLFNVYTLHAQGAIHRDIKLNNLLLQQNGLIKAIDFGSVCAIRPGEKIKSRNPYCTYEFAPPECSGTDGTYYYGEFTDAFSVAKCLQLILYPVAFKHDGKDYFIAKHNQAIYAELNAHFMLGVEKKYGKELADAIAKLLLANVENRGTIADLIKFCTENYPDLVDAILRTYIDEVKAKVNDKLMANRELGAWFNGLVSKVQSARLFNAYNLSSLLLLQILERCLFVLDDLFGFDCTNVQENINKVLIDVMQRDLTKDNVYDVHEQITAIAMYLLEARKCLFSKIIALRDYLLLSHDFKPEDVVIIGLGLLHNKVEYLLRTNKSLPKVLNYSIRTISDLLKEIEDVDLHVSLAINTLLSEITAHLDKLHDDSQQPIPDLICESLLFSIPKSISPVGKFYSDAEIEYNLDSIVNDCADSARLSRLLEKSVRSGRVSLPKKLLIKHASISEIVSTKLSLKDSMLDGRFAENESMFRLILNNICSASTISIKQQEEIRVCVEQAVHMRCLERLTILLTAISNSNTKILSPEFMQSMLNLAYDRYSFDKDILLLLVKHGADPASELKRTNQQPGYLTWLFGTENPYTKFGKIPFSIMQIAVERKDFDFLAELANFVIDISNLGVHLVIAARHNSDTAVKALLENGADPDELYPSGWFKGSNAAWFAAYFRNEKMQRALDPRSKPKTSKLAWLCV